MKAPVPIQVEATLCRGVGALVVLIVVQPVVPVHCLFMQTLPDGHASPQAPQFCCVLSAVSQPLVFEPSQLAKFGWQAIWQEPLLHAADAVF